MKKILTLCAGLLLVFGLSACDEGGDLPHPGEEEPDPTTEVEPGEETGGEGTEGGEIGGESEPDPSNPSSELLNFESVSFVDSPYTLEVGAERATQIEVKPEGLDVSVSYTSKQSLIATIDNDGVITGIGEGETEVYATVSAEGYNDAIAIAEVKVEAQHVETDYVKSISFLQSSGYTFKVGETYDFKDTNGVFVDVSGSASQDFTLTCDTDGYTEYFTINGTSIVALKATTSPITLKAIATGDTSKTAETTITITDKDEVTSVEFIDDNGTTTSTFNLGLKEDTCTLDLSSHVRVSGTGDYSQEYTLSLANINPEGCATLEGNVVTAVSEGTATVTVTAGEHTASATITIVDDNVYVDSISFALNSYELWTGEIDNEHPEEMVVGVSVKYTDDSTSSDAYSISIATGGDSVVSYDEITKTLTAVNDGSTQITATSTETKKDGSNATATVNVTVSHNDILISSIHFSSETWEVKEQLSFTIGPSGATADVTVTTEPDNVDESWELKTDDTNITIGEADGNGVYTVTASALTDTGVTETASITVTPTSGTEGVSDTLTVSIVPYDSDIKYVSSITLNPTTKTINELEEFTIGASEGENDVTVTVEPNTATDPSYTVSCENTDKIEVTGSGDSWTVKALKGAGGEEEGGQEYDIVVTANDGSGVAPTLKLTVNRPVAVATEITVTSEGSLGLTSHNALDDSTPDSIDLRSTLTVVVTDQYGNEFTGTGGSEYTLSTSSELINLDETTGLVTAVAGASGTATVIVTSVANTELYESVSITVTPKVYAVESISVDPNSATVAWGETYTPTVTITPAYADEKGYTIAYSSGDEIFDIEGEGTALKHKGVTAGSETFTITANDTTNSASCTLTLTVEKELDEPSAVTFTGLNSSYEKGATIDNLNSYVSVSYAHDGESSDHYEQDGYTLSFESGSDSIISVSNTDGTWSATCANTGTTTLTAVVTPDKEGASPVTSDPVSIQVVIKATGVVIDGATSYDLVVGDSSSGSVQLSASFTPDGATDTEGKTILWKTDNAEVATVSTSGLVTAVGAGTTTITAYYGSWEASVSISVTEPVVPYESMTFTFTLNGSDGYAFPDAPDGVSIYLGTDCFDTTWQYYSMTSAGSSVYTYTTTATLITGTHYVTIYAYNGTGEIYSHELGSYQLTISGTETGAVVETHTYQLSYSSWDDIFPTHDGSTNFYILAFETTGTTTNFSNLNYLESGSAYFGGSADVATTKGTAPSGQYYVYNSVAGSASAEDRNNWFTFYQTGWNIQCPCGTIDIPDCEEGYAVYVCCNENDGVVKPSEGNAWTPWTPTHGVPTGITLNNGWATGVTSIEEFINTIQPTGSAWLS